MNGGNSEVEVGWSMVRVQENNGTPQDSNKVH
jgi:hypothetical protein